IRRAQGFLSNAHICGEILIADNGSTDGSREIAKKEGARAVDVSQRGDGPALLGGSQVPRGRDGVIGDADGSYDFPALAAFIECLRSGADVVMGNRFKGGIAPQAMPLLHRYIGNPILSWIGRLFFSINIGDFHCGLRGLRRDRIDMLRLRTSGMEFASEMVVRAALAGYRIDEVPTTLSKDGRSRAPHLRTWRDGRRHLCFPIMNRPNLLLVSPRILLFLAGLVTASALLPGPVRIGNVAFEIHPFTAA